MPEPGCTCKECTASPEEQLMRARQRIQELPSPAQAFQNLALSNPQLIDDLLDSMKLQSLYHRVRHHLEGTISSTELESRKALVANLDFGCDFKDGKCVGRRRGSTGKYSSDFYSSPQCCCIRCAAAMGYLGSASAEAKAYLQDVFDLKLGFWTERGCAIPHKWRSNTCLGYSCRFSKDMYQQVWALLRPPHTLTKEEVTEAIRKVRDANKKK